MGVACWLFLSVKVNVEGLGEAVPKVMGGTGLEGLAVVHHALNGVGLAPPRRTSPCPSSPPRITGMARSFRRSGRSIPAWSSVS